MIYAMSCQVHMYLELSLEMLMLIHYYCLIYIYFFKVLILLEMVYTSPKQIVNNVLPHKHTLTLQS